MRCVLESDIVARKIREQILAYPTIPARVALCRRELSDNLDTVTLKCWRLEQYWQWWLKMDEQGAQRFQRAEEIGRQIEGMVSAAARLRSPLERKRDTILTNWPGFEFAFETSKGSDKTPAVFSHAMLDGLVSLSLRDKDWTALSERIANECCRRLRSRPKNRDARVATMDIKAVLSTVPPLPTKKILGSTPSAAASASASALPPDSPSTASIEQGRAGSQAPPNNRPSSSFVHDAISFRPSSSLLPGPAENASRHSLQIEDSTAAPSEGSAMLEPDMALDEPEFAGFDEPDNESLPKRSRPEPAFFAGQTAPNKRAKKNLAAASSSPPPPPTTTTNERLLETARSRVRMDELALEATAEPHLMASAALEASRTFLSSLERLLAQAPEHWRT